jgi:hypothetical protein
VQTLRPGNRVEKVMTELDLTRLASSLRAWKPALVQGERLSAGKWAAQVGGEPGEDDEDRP